MDRVTAVKVNQMRLMWVKRTRAFIPQRSDVDAFSLFMNVEKGREIMCTPGMAQTLTFEDGVRVGISP